MTYVQLVETLPRPPTRIPSFVCAHRTYQRQHLIPRTAPTIASTIMSSPFLTPPQSQQSSLRPGMVPDVRPGMPTSTLRGTLSSMPPSMPKASALPVVAAIPNATPQPRNLILMLDGTSNQFSEHNSNLIKLMSVVKADEAQLLFYSSGVGESWPLSERRQQFSEAWRNKLQEACATKFVQVCC